MSNTIQGNVHGFSGIRQSRNSVTTLATASGLAAGVASGFDLFRGGARSAALKVGSSVSDAAGAGSLVNLFQQQLAAQREMQVFTMQTNISKTQHEARMSAIRNIRP